MRSAPETFFFDGNGGGRLGLRLSLAPSARTALRPGEGPCDVGFSISIHLVVEAFMLNAYLPDSALGTSAATMARLTGAVLFRG